MRLGRSLGAWLIVPLITFGICLAGFMALASSGAKVRVKGGSGSQVGGAIALALAGKSGEFAGSGCTIVFTDTTHNHDWHTVANWAPARLPGPDDVACVPAGSKIVIKHDVKVKRFVNHGDMTIAGGNVDFGSGTSG
jgi:hypothetical protein